MAHRQCPSPNFGHRRGGAAPSLVVLHYTAMDSADAALQRMCDPGTEVSAHYLIDERGETIQMVDEADRAWHAGAGQWRGIDDVNSHSIGIELANSGAAPFTHRQMCALEALLARIMQRHGIPAEGVIGHSDMAPGRKSDPGARFDWQRLARQGLAVWPGLPGDGGAAARNTGDPDPQSFRTALGAFGYPSGEEISDETLLHAFRMRFRPGGAGLDRFDLAIAESLADRFAVDRASRSS
ncbi:MAG: N-acetylmuramoyl-L-alanine amidase [Alphaproteobacteria bacterium]|nr:N-acetylmuramoyl-L-alanine amidase [Alphaproteobacteria bacterium]NNF23530.1 N-acetylmuramoyl-L-alanine amidase [Paracoccaceae bacterium]